jgi:hypothetical protein
MSAKREVARLLLSAAVLGELRVPRRTKGRPVQACRGTGSVHVGWNS